MNLHVFRCISVDVCEHACVYMSVNLWMSVNMHVYMSVNLWMSVNMHV